MKMLALFVIPFVCLGAEFGEVFEKAALNSPILRAKHEKILASHEAIKGEAVYKNPVLSIGVNDLLLNENFLKRDIEPMQTNFIGITQEFETFGKLDLKEAILRVDTLILEYELEDLKLDLYKKTALIVEKIITFSNLLELLERKKTNLKILIDYYEKSISVESGFRKSVELQKKIFAVEDKILELQESVQRAKNEFKYLTNQEFIPMQQAQIGEDFMEEDIKKAPKYKIFELRSRQLEIAAKLEERKKYSNISLSLSYNHRQNFDDYLSVSTSFALPIYGSEDAKAKKTRYLKQESIQNAQNYLQNATMIFQNNRKKAEYFSKRVENLDAILEKYKALGSYEKSNIRNSVTLERSIEDENLLFDLEIERLKYKLEIKAAELELFYITKESI
ncbi:MAG TPA: TolC family protein [Sulfurimonas sp.]